MSASVEMPKYQCHKKVWALRIADLQPTQDGDLSWWITPAEPEYDRFKVPMEYVHKHAPHIGGYYVVYEDGYKSFSPAAAFEAGYTKL